MEYKNTEQDFILIFLTKQINTCYKKSRWYIADLPVNPINCTFDKKIEFIPTAKVKITDIYSDAYEAQMFLLSGNFCEYI